MHKKILLLALGMTVSSATAANILGSTTSFSKTPLCKQLACKVSGNAQVGPYLFVTYATRDTFEPGSSGYFAFQRDGRTVAVGVFGIGSQDSSSAGTLQEVTNLVKLTGQPLPNLKGAMENVFPSTPPFFARTRSVTLPLGAGSVLTNKSQRFVLGSDPVTTQRLAPPPSALRYVDVAYVALSSEVNTIASYINRWSPRELAQAKAAFIRSMGLKSSCPVVLSSGQTLATEKVGYNDVLSNRLVAQGYGFNHNTLYVAYPLPGLALSSLEIGNNPRGNFNDMSEAAKSPACIR